MMGGPNVAAGIYEYQMILVNGLGLALSRRNPNNSAELDPVFYAMHILSIRAICGAIILDFKHSRTGANI